MFLETMKRIYIVANMEIESWIFQKFVILLISIQEK